MIVIVLFGKIGSGKTFAGEILKNHYHFYHYEGDQDLPLEMLEALNSNKPISDKMRGNFFKRLFINLKKIIKIHEKVVVSQTFIKEKYRKQLLNNIPEAQLFYIETSDKNRLKRLGKRIGNKFKIDYISQMDKNFEAPTIPVKKIINNVAGETEILRQLKEIFSS